MCSRQPPAAAERARVLWFFRAYGWAKGLLNVLRRQSGATASRGWGSADAALARARPVGPGQRREPVIAF
jgi:hypothetical protein